MLSLSTLGDLGVFRLRSLDFDLRFGIPSSSAVRTEGPGRSLLLRFLPADDFVAFASLGLLLELGVGVLEVLFFFLFFFFFVLGLLFGLPRLGLLGLLGWEAGDLLFFGDLVSFSGVFLCGDFPVAWLSVFLFLLFFDRADLLLLDDFLSAVRFFFFDFVFPLFPVLGELGDRFFETGLLAIFLGLALKGSLGELLAPEEADGCCFVERGVIFVSSFAGIAAIKLVAGPEREMCGLLP